MNKTTENIKAKTSKAKETVKAKTKTAVSKVKKTPQKIVEHTLNKAIDSVEKAAIKQEKKTVKAIAKKIAKTEKQKQKIDNKEAVSKITTAKRSLHRIKDKIKTTVHHNKEEIFYYSTKKLVLLTLAYAFMSFILYGLVNCMYLRGLLNCWCILAPVILVMVLTLSALASAVFVLIYPQTLAVVNSKGIKIDHNEPLLWQDVATAEELRTNGYSYRSIIRLNLKKDAKYKLTFMQKLCQHNLYTPFSIPLYAMDEKDIEKIRKIVKKYTKYKSLIK